MGWIYLAVEDGSPKVWRHGLSQLPTVKTTLSLNECCYLEYIGEKSQPRQSGMTLELFALECSRHKSIASTEDSHAKDTALQELVNAWRTAARNFSGRLCAWQKKQKPRSFFSKMSGRGLDGLYLRSELHLKALVTRVEMGTWRHPMWGCRTDVKDGSCLPTPTRTEGGYNRGGGRGLMPTPTVKGNYNKKGLSKTSGDGLATWWKKHGSIPTPTKSDERPGGYKADLNRNSPPLPALWKETTGTQLPPSFVEWIMASRIGATVLESWAIPSRGFSTKKRLKD